MSLCLVPCREGKALCSLLNFYIFFNGEKKIQEDFLEDDVIILIEMVVKKERIHINGVSDVDSVEINSKVGIVAVCQGGSRIKRILTVNVRDMGVRKDVGPNVGGPSDVSCMDNIISKEKS